MLLVVPQNSTGAKDLREENEIWERCRIITLATWILMTMFGVLNSYEPSKCCNMQSMLKYHRPLHSSFWNVTREYWAWLAIDSTLFSLDLGYKRLQHQHKLWKWQWKPKSCDMYASCCFWKLKSNYTFAISTCFWWLLQLQINLHTFSSFDSRLPKTSGRFC
jgi:hypothetical protein